MMRLTRPLLLASGSPRRQYLLKHAGFEFTVHVPQVSEDFAESMPAETVPRFLAERKAEALRPNITNEIIIAADTVVIIDGRVLNKPANAEDAFAMLSMLNGRTHRVVTAVCLMDKTHQLTFADRTRVTFARLTDEELKFYIERDKPFDKAGGYGAQDWIGMIGISRIEGSYFTVMGMPMHRLNQELKKFDW